VSLTSLAWQPATPEPVPVAFHHLHLTDGGDRLISFYERMFDPDEVERFELWGAEALRTGNVLLLASNGTPGATPSPQPSAIWHYGWGAVSLGETYLDHNLREVAWEPPLPARGFHLHLESVTPNVAAAWYREYLGADVEFASRVEPTPNRDLRRPAALVRVGSVAMLFYKTDQPLASTRGKRADHLAFAVPDLAAVLTRLRAAEVVVLEPPRRFDNAMAALVEGPDRVAIELVELDAR
jgi:catechol 2,3-dioxygenase-like lactoylglutathione lyase family enzyme